jgi:N-acyl-D-aspartate/D-glutamate deacylase
MTNLKKQWDLLIKNPLVFDGTGSPAQQYDIAMKNGKIVAKGIDLDEKDAAKVIDAKGKWLMPGLIDIHCHFDLEVEVAPELPETVRHGTTTVVNGNCSLGVAFGKQASKERPWENPILDCFARVENIPKSVLAMCVEKAIHWNNPIDYIRHFDQLALGPNVCVLLPHSMLRIEAMGLEDSISREPTASELQKMCQITEEALNIGFIGFSSDGLPLHYLANDPHKNAKIPAQHASIKEIMALGHVTRKTNRIWQCTPDPDHLLRTAAMFFMTSGKIHGKPLTMTATAAMDLNSNKRAKDGLLRFSKFLNSKLMQGDFTFQALSAPFRVYADGVTTPLMEEKEAFRELNCIEVEDSDSRRALLSDPSYIERFRKDWMRGKEGFNLARLQRKLHVEPTTFSRNLSDMFIDTCPVDEWQGQNLGDIYQRLLQFQASGGNSGAASPNEAEEFKKFPMPIVDDALFMVHLLKEWDKQFRWYTTTANVRPDVLKELVFHEETLPGFNDSGAHLTNMAFYDGNLRTLKMAAEDSLELVSVAVKRLTRDPARMFNINAGTLDIGAQADIVIINPDELLKYDSLANTQMLHRELFQHKQMVNRSDGVVDKTIIAGKIAWDGKKYTPKFGKEPFGRLLKPKDIDSLTRAQDQRINTQENITA